MKEDRVTSTLRGQYVPLARVPRARDSTNDALAILQRTVALSPKYISRQPLKGFRPSFVP